MKKFGMDHNLLRWIKSFLSERSVAIKIKWLFMLILNALSDKYDLNHVIDFSAKPIACNLPRRISSFIVSKTF